MALTVKQEMNYLSPIYDKNPIVLDSDYNGEDNFYYRFNIIDKDSTSTQSRVPSDPYGFGIFDANFIAKNEVSYDFQPTTTNSAVNPNAVYQYKLQCGTASDGDFDSLVDTYIVNAFNANFQLGEDSDLTTYQLNDTNSKFLSDFDEDTDIILTGNDYYTFNYIHGWFNVVGGGYSLPFRLNITFHKENGTTENKLLTETGVYEYVSTSTFETNYGNLVQTIGMGPQNLLNTTFDDSSTLASDYFDDVTHYTLYAETNVSFKTSITYTVKLKCDRGYNRYQIFYLNHLGAFDAITFTTGNVEQQKQSTSTFYKDPWKSNGVGGYNFTQGNRGLTTHTKVIEKTLSLTTDLVSEKMLPIYERFFQSPVHILFKDGKEYPMILSSSKINLEDKMNRKMYQIDYDFMYANKTKINV